MTSIGKTGNDTSPANMLAQLYFRGTAKPRSFEDTTLENIGLKDPVKADALKKQLDDAKQAVAQFKNIKQDAGQSKKAAARDKVDRIKEQIKALRMMGGDPKTIARQVAQLARELAAAAGEYTSVGGGAAFKENTVSADAATSNAGGNAASSNVARSGSIDSVAADVSVAVSSEPVSSGTEDDKSKSISLDTTSKMPTGAALTEDAKQYRDNLKQQIKDDLENKIAELQQKSSGTDADRAFAQEVRILAAQLKALAKQQENRLRQAGDHTADSELSKTNQALAEVERSVSTIMTLSFDVSSSVNITA